MKRNAQFGIALVAGLITYTALLLGGAPRFRQHHEPKSPAPHSRFFHKRCFPGKENVNEAHCKQFHYSLGSVSQP